MHRILEYVWDTGHFASENVVGYFEGIPFTFDEWNTFTEDLHQKLAGRA